MLHLTKVAFGAQGVDDLRQRLANHADKGEVRLTTRYRPKRDAEMAGGSLFWILGHMLVGRSPILGFADNGEGRVWIRLEPRLIPVVPVPRRAHQGWRYLEDKGAPRDADAVGDGDGLPAPMASELGRLGLL